MNKKTLGIVSVISFLLVLFVIFYSLYKSPVINENKNIDDILIERGYLLTAQKNPEIISHGGKVNYSLIKKEYPSATIAVVAGYSVGETNTPVGLCVEDGYIVNRAISFDMGLLFIHEKDNNVIMSHGSELSYKDNLSCLYAGSVLQVQSLIRNSKIASLENNTTEDHFLMIETDSGCYIHYEYDKLSYSINHLRDLNVLRAFKLGGGSANACAIFNEDGTTTYIGDTNNSPYVVSVLIFE